MRVLCADDEPAILRLVEAALVRHGHQVETVGNGLEAAERLGHEDAPRVAVLDWEMPGLDGIEVTRRVRASGRASYVYLVLLTARADRRDVVLGLREGADDFLSKPFDPETLLARLSAAERALRALESDGEPALDPVTGLPSRAGAVGHLERELLRCQRAREPLSVALVDVDRLARLQEAAGRDVGDAALRGVAGRLRVALRALDGLARYGGDEFLVTLPGCDAAAMQPLAQRLLSCVAQAPLRLGGAERSVTVSLGSASVGRDATATADELLAAADAALGRAKRRAPGASASADAADWHGARP